MYETTCETFEEITVRLMSDEYQQSELTMQITVRIWHDDAGGMQAEPAKYRIVDGRAAALQDFGDCDRAMHWRLAQWIVERDYDQAALDAICSNEPAFAGLAIVAANERAADEAWIRRQQV